GGRGVPAGDAVLHRPDRRGGSDAPHRLHQVAFREELVMSAITADLPASYLGSEHTLASWLLTRDHKRIALLFFGSITFFFFIGGAAATVIRLHLVNPYGTLLQPEVYNRMFTMHGIVMVWFFLIPSIPATLGNFLI